MIPTRIEERIEQNRALQQSGRSLARALHSAVLRGGEPLRALADVLHGKQLGHPLHPILTDIPIGAWTLAAVFDLLAAFRASPEAERTADMLIQAGVIAAVPTALAGVADYSTIPEPAAATGTLHGLLNGGALALYLLALRDRRNGERGRGVQLAALAYALVGMSGALGGDLVYRHRVGVNRNQPADQPEQWTAALDLADLPDREPQRVELDGQAVLIYRDGGEVFAIGAVCSHAGGPLEEGEVRGGCVRCPWHDSVFDLRDGHVVHGPATTPQPRYQARVRDGRVEVRAVQH